MRWRSIEISFLTLDCHLWWNAKIQKSILSMKCQIYYNYEDESWPSGSQERRKDRLLCWSILHVPCSLAANLRAILVQGVFRHYVSLCSNKFLLEYLTLESDSNTRRLRSQMARQFWGIQCCICVCFCTKCGGVSQHSSWCSALCSTSSRKTEFGELQGCEGIAAIWLMLPFVLSRVLGGLCLSPDLAFPTVWAMSWALNVAPRCAVLQWFPKGIPMSPWQPISLVFQA